MTRQADPASLQTGPLPLITYVSWAENCSRSDHTARELGGRSHMIYEAKYGSRPSTILAKYATQWRRTAALLKAERPEAVFVMTPPLVAAMPAFLYAWRSGARVVLDAHSAAFLHPRWRWWQWLQRAMCRRAATTLVHNAHVAGLVRDAGGHATLVPDVPIVFDEIEPLQRPAAFVVAVVCSFNYDEPVAAIWAAARLMPDVCFYVTGNRRHLAPDLASNVPSNVTLTGFVSTAAYGGLLQGADVVLTLTTRDHTMLRGAYEAIYQATPVIVSDWPVLREAFPEGALHVDNSPEAIAGAVRRIAADIAGFRAGAERMRLAKNAAWSHTRSSIVSRLRGAPHGGYPWV